MALFIVQHWFEDAFWKTRFVSHTFQLVKWCRIFMKFCVRGTGVTNMKLMGVILTVEQTFACCKFCHVVKY
jgi:hypothetical protein